MKILAIETSCDDTGVAVVEVSGYGRFQVFSNEVSSQIEIHKKYGGVFPMMAKREHQHNVVPVFEKALEKASLLIKKPKFQNQKPVSASQLKTLKCILAREDALFEKLINFLEKYEKPDIDYIAIVHGPGLEPCLWVGVNFAKALSYLFDIPLIPVNHIESHILVNFLEGKTDKKIFPALSLVVSGGHTQLILVKKIGNYKIIGETRDDAAGECFDKAAKILGLSYPGGPIISKIADKSDRRRASIILPRPMMNSKDYDFSFSGLKTAVLYKVRDFESTTIHSRMVAKKKFLKEMCCEVQQTIVDVLLKKTFMAAKDLKVKSIILGGGVSANKELRKQFETQALKFKIPLLVPPSHLSTDNALMSAVTGYFHRKDIISWQKLKVDANLRVGK